MLIDGDLTIITIIFKDKKKAIKCADDHCDYRGAKYSCIVEELRLDFYEEDSEESIKEIYQTKINFMQT